MPDQCKPRTLGSLMRIKTGFIVSSSVLLVAACTQEPTGPAESPKTSVPIVTANPSATVHSTAEHLSVSLTLTPELTFFVTISNKGKRPVVIGQVPDHILIYHEDPSGKVAPVTFDLSLTDASPTYPFDTVYLAQNSTFTLELKPYNDMHGNSRSALLKKPGSVYAVLKPLEPRHFHPELSIPEVIVDSFLKDQVISARITVPL